MRRTPSGVFRRDSYEILMRETRGLRREHTHEREQWFSALDLEDKAEILFELEMLLKGLVCFFNPRNHPGTRRGSPLAHDFREEMRIAAIGIERIVSVCRRLLGERDRRFTFDRFLETLLVSDHDRMRLNEEQTRQRSPDQSLALLRKSFASLGDVCTGIGRLARVPYRQFVAVGHLATREITASVYFNPLLQLEFRHEYDRIRAPKVLEVIHGMESEAGQKVVALAFLAMFRLLRYVSAAKALLESEEPLRIAFLVLAVFRSDAQALAVYLRRDTGDVLAEGFEKEVLGLEAASLGSSATRLEQEFVRLRELRRTLDTIGTQLRIEIRRAFGQVLAAPDPEMRDEDVAPALGSACATLAAFLEHSIVRLVREFRPSARGEEIFRPYLSPRFQAEQLRKDVWMFAQILRAFVAKASSSADVADRWAGFASFQFVREFVRYFRQMGYPLLRESDYGRFTEFMVLVTSLSDSDVLEETRLAAAVRSCEDFYAYLMQTFDAIGRREELAEVAFDRKDAAETLKLYLSA